ncbi:cadherin-like domain-containing protein [Pseudomonas stutzeri]|nr:cadherin-like domain-containing protein [Stutzerimonas stutzeri]
MDHGADLVEGDVAIGGHADGEHQQVGGGRAAFHHASYTYTPPADFHGTDTVDYTVTDGSLTDTATLTLTVTPVNDAPVAQNDAVTVSEDVPFSSSISLLANDSDVDGDSLSVVAGTFVTKVPATTDRLSPSTSLSLASRLMLELNGTSSLTVTASFWATGASFTGATLTVTVAVLETRLPSVTV